MSLLTVGYEGRSAEEVVDDLVAKDVSLLVDVRLTPISRKPGLSKRGLAERLAAAGIEYLHLRALGNPVDNRDGFRAGTSAARDRFRELLGRPEAAQAVETVADRARRQRVALLCFEADPARCHRQLVGEAVARVLGDGPVPPAGAPA
ncbi:DUF488 domain-containing protein [Pseudonocardia lacus]|uniref:DUF488 domain-containing protein n=1 Tax=Pseudonocardia lacus TaxID=2835865 RepID=UPI0027E2BE78|nr:DUF488 domain-containing protein [Pseudonocardia lacus]